MGKIDTVTTKYMRRNEIFADAFNYFIYDGEQVIDPNSLEELDTKEIGVPYGGEEGAEQPVQKTRDVIKTVTAMMDKKTAYLVLAVESQANVHYAMPIKSLVYDALQYERQVQKAISSHKRSGDYSGAGGEEYLSGFMKNDRLMPVVTLVIYFGAKAWDGPLSVHEMFQKTDEKILAIVPDYRINLIAPASIKEEDLGKFQTSLKEVLTFIKYSGDADKLESAVNTNEHFRHLGRDEVDVLNACTKAELPMEESEVELDVCQAIQTLNQRSEARGKAEGKLEGKAEGKAEGKLEGKIEANLQAIKNLMQNLGLSLEEAMNAMGLSDSDRKMISSKM